MKLAVRNLLHDSVRCGLSVVGVSLAIMLILLLNGLTNGLSRQVSAYIDHAPGSVIVGQASVKNLLGGNSLLPATTVAATRSVEGIDPTLAAASCDKTRRIKKEDEEDGDDSYFGRK